MKKKLPAIIIIVLVIGAALIINLFTGNGPMSELLLSGNVEVTESDIGFKTAGRVEELLAEEGQRIEKAEKLAVLDSAELENQVLLNKAFLQESLARLEELRAGSRPQEIAQAEANVNYAEAELNKAARDLERAGMLFKEELVSVQQMDAAKKAYDIAVAGHERALQALSLVKEGARKEEIRAAESRVEQARAALKVSEERLKDTLIYSPASGVVLRKNIELGETVSPGLPVYTIGDTENPWIRVYVMEDKLGHVKLGQIAEVSVDSYPGKVYEGKVTYISSEAEFTPKNIQTQEERVKLVFGVKVSVKNTSDELKPGMPADVRISLR